MPKVDEKLLEIDKRYLTSREVEDLERLNAQSR